MRRVLMIAHWFPPVNVSGSARPFYFAKHLPDFGYEPTVIAADQGMDAHTGQDREVLTQLPGNGSVIRVRHYSPRDLLKRSVNVLPVFRPAVGGGAVSVRQAQSCDRVADEGGLFGGFMSRFRHQLRLSILWPAEIVLAALRAWVHLPFDIIWATGDPWSGLMAGYWLSRMTGRPLVVDVRDPWTYGFGVIWTPVSKQELAWHVEWEHRILQRSRRCVYTSPLTTEIMQRRMGAHLARKMVTITNGYDEVSCQPLRYAPSNECLFAFIGKVSFKYRSPEPVLAAFRRACRVPGFGDDARIQFIGQTEQFDGCAQRHGVQEQASFHARVSEAESRALMRGADVLVLLQTLGGRCGDVVSGKAYEYLSAGRPILGIVADDGGDAWLLKMTGTGLVTGNTDVERIAEGFLHYWRLWKANRLVVPKPGGEIEQFSRRNLTKRLARLFDGIMLNE